MQNEISHFYNLNEPISNLSVVGMYFLFLAKS